MGAFCIVKQNLLQLTHLCFVTVQSACMYIRHHIFLSIDGIPSIEEWQGSFLRRKNCATLYLSRTLLGHFFFMAEDL